MPTPPEAIWMALYQQVASNALGVLLGLIGGVLGIFWIIRALGLPGLFERWVKTSEDGTAAVKELTLLVKSLVSESVNIQRANASNHTQAMDSLRSVEHGLERLNRYIRNKSGDIDKDLD